MFQTTDQYIYIYTYILYTQWIYWIVAAPGPLGSGTPPVPWLVWRPQLGKPEAEEAGGAVSGFIWVYYGLLWFEGVWSFWFTMV